MTDFTHQEGAYSWRSTRPPQQPCLSLHRRLHLCGQPQRSVHLQKSSGGCLAQTEVQSDSDTSPSAAQRAARATAPGVGIGESTPPAPQKLAARGGPLLAQPDAQAGKQGRHPGPGLCPEISDWNRAYLWAGPWFTPLANRCILVNVARITMRSSQRRLELTVPSRTVTWAGKIKGCTTFVGGRNDDYCADSLAFTSPKLVWNFCWNSLTTAVLLPLASTQN